MVQQTFDTATADIDITVRSMRPQEGPEVREMFRRSFPLLLRLFFSWPPYTFVAERGGFGARWLAMRWAAASRGLEVRFRTWETGLLVSLGVALILGGLFPVPGGAYSISSRWNYRNLLPKLGSLALAALALAGVLPTLVLTGAAWGPPGLEGWIGRAVRRRLAGPLRCCTGLLALRELQRPANRGVEPPPLDGTGSGSTGGVLDLNGALSHLSSAAHKK